MRHVEVTVGSASLDEPETLFVEETRAVRRAISALRRACRSDGFVEVHRCDHSQRGAICTEAEFLDWAANFIGGTADEIARLVAEWKTGDPPKD